METLYRYYSEKRNYLFDVIFMAFEWFLDIRMEKAS